MVRVVVGDTATTALLPQFCGTVQSWNGAREGALHEGSGYHWVDIVVWENMFLLSEVNDHALAGVVGGGDTFTQRVDRLLAQAGMGVRPRHRHRRTTATFQSTDFAQDVATEMYRTVDSVEVIVWPGKDGMLMFRDRTTVPGASGPCPPRPKPGLGGDRQRRRHSSSHRSTWPVSAAPPSRTPTSGSPGRYQRRSKQRTDLATVAEPGDADLARVANRHAHPGPPNLPARLVRHRIRPRCRPSTKMIVEADITDLITLEAGPDHVRPLPGLLGHP